MAGVDFFVSEASAREYGADGISALKIALILSENCILSGGCVGFEKLVCAQIIGILHISRGVMLGNIESLEAVVIVGNLAVILNIESHRKEDILNLALNKSDGMIRAEVNADGHRFIIALGRIDESLNLFLFYLGELCGDAVFNKLLNFVYFLAGLFLLLVGDIPELLHKRLNIALLAEEFNPQLLNIRGGVCLA